MPYKVYLVDDAHETLETLSLQYGIHPELDVYGMADDSRTAWEAMEARRPDIVSIDIELGSDSGFELCARVVREMPGVFVVMCTVDADDERKRQATRAGAHWFLAKPVSYRDIRELLEAVQKSRATGGEHATDGVGGQNEADKSLDEEWDAYLARLRNL